MVSCPVTGIGTGGYGGYGGLILGGAGWAWKNIYSFLMEFGRVLSFYSINFLFFFLQFSHRLEM
jgi:hypothetical protein